MRALKVIKTVRAEGKLALNIFMRLIWYLVNCLQFPNNNAYYFLWQKAVFGERGRERGKRGEKVRILTIILFRGLGLGFLREVQIGMGNICLDGSKGFFRHQKIKYKEPPLKKIQIKKNL
jgi:hypothetical protein